MSFIKKSLAAGCVMAAVCGMVFGYEPPAEPFQPVGLADVQVGGEIGHRMDITAHGNLLKLDYENDFFPDYNPESGRNKNYVGLGRTFDAVTRLAKNLNDPELKELRAKILEHFLANQEPSGYLGTFRNEEERIGQLWDVHEMSSVIKSLVSDYECWGEQRSLEAARKMADYIIERYDRVPTGIMDGCVDNFASLEEFENAVLRVGMATGDDRYWCFIEEKRETPVWTSPIVTGREEGILGHTTAYLERNVAQLNLYRITGNPDLLNCPRFALDFMVNGEGMAVTGATSQTEIWTNDQDGRYELGETCAVANELKLFDMFIRLEKSGLCGDLMERTIFNTLFAAQSPDGRKLRYYTPFEGPRVFYPADIYCCPGIFRRAISELPMMIYYKTADGVAVNLYTESVLNTTLLDGSNITLTQKTDYPTGGDIEMTVSIDQEKERTFEFRIPHFAKDVQICVNGKPVNGTPKAGSFFALRRTWKDGDTVSIHLPMDWRLVKGRQQQAGRVCVMRGPLVYSLNQHAYGMTQNMDASDVGMFYINPDSLGELIREDSIRPNGTKVKVQLGNRTTNFGFDSDEFYLWEFPDPDSEIIYFRMRNYSKAVDDDLFHQKPFENTYGIR